jgi:hypothetical protein
MWEVPEYGTDMPVKSVKVALSAINFKGLEGYDLDTNTPNDRPGDKVLIDNMSQASNGFIFDNTVVRNVRSRGLLVKASECKMVNCSFENIGMSCAAILYEIFWGESGVTENMLVARNVFDHTGYFNTEWDRYAPIAIEGTSRGKPMLTNEFLLTHCRRSYQLLVIRSPEEYRLCELLCRLGEAAADKPVFRRVGERHIVTLADGRIRLLDASGHVLLDRPASALRTDPADLLRRIAGALGL